MERTGSLLQQGKGAQPAEPQPAVVVSEETSRGGNSKGGSDKQTAPAPLIGVVAAPVLATLTPAVDVLEPASTPVAEPQAASAEGAGNGKGSGKVK